MAGWNFPDYRDEEQLLEPQTQAWHSSTPDSLRRCRTRQNLTGASLPQIRRGPGPSVAPCAGAADDRGACRDRSDRAAARRCSVHRRDTASCGNAAGAGGRPRLPGRQPCCPRKCSVDCKRGRCEPKRSGDFNALPARLLAPRQARGIPRAAEAAAPRAMVTASRVIRHGRSVDRSGRRPRSPSGIDRQAAGVRRLGHSGGREGAPPVWQPFRPVLQRNSCMTKAFSMKPARSCVTGFPR